MFSTQMSMPRFSRFIFSLGTTILHRDLLWNSFDSLEECIELVLEHLFDREKMFSDLLVKIMIGRDDILCLCVGCKEEFSDFLVDEILGLI